MSLTSKYVGIINQGSTCYLNSVIQTLYHLPYFRNAVFALKPKEPHPVVTALQNLFAELAAGSRHITTTELTNAFGWDAREAAVQHDVHELMQQLFDMLEKITKGSSDETLVRDLFGGQLIYRSRATDGVNYVSDRLEGFYDVELVVEKKRSLDDSLVALTTAEKIEGVSIEVSPGAKPSKHNIERTLSFLELPPVLLVHPNRVSFDMETFESITLGNHWSFDTQLCLKQYMVDPSGLKLDKESTAKRDKLQRSTRNVDQLRTGTEYELRSVVVHAGDANVGHYFLYVRFSGDEWVLFNDDAVETVSWADVQKAAFGGAAEQATDGRYRPFGQERGSLLVYVNRMCADVLLHEEAPSAEVLEVAKRIANERSLRWSNVSFKFYIGDTSFINVLDGVPGAEKELQRSVLVGTQSSQDELEAALGENLAIDKRRVRLFIVQLPARNYNFPVNVVGILPESASQHHSTDDRYGSALYFFREYVHGARNFLPPSVVRSVDELKRLLRQGYSLYEYRASVQKFYNITKEEDLRNGGNYIFARSDVSVEILLNQLRARQRYKTEVMQVQEGCRASMQRLCSLTVDETTTLSALQGGLYDLCKPSNLLWEMPKSSEYLGFLFYDTYIAKPLERLVPTHYYQKYGEGERVEVTHRELCRGAKNPKLYVMVLPLPRRVINEAVLAICRVGWAAMPMVFFKNGETEVTAFEFVKRAITQPVTAVIPESLKKRFEAEVSTKPGTLSVARVLLVRHGRILSRYTRAQDVIPLNIEHDQTFVVDPLCVVMADHRLVDVIFCSRRKGEDYFGFPTNVLISNALTETGAVVVKRVMKKLSVPNPDTSASRWLLYVKNVTTNKMKLCEPKDTLANVLKELGEQTAAFELLIDRPIAAELDGLEVPDLRMDESGGIVIKSASTADLSSM